MRRKPILALGLAGLACVATGIAGPPAAEGHRTASGSGSIAFGDHGDGVAMFDFNVNGASATPEGSLLCAAEDHHAYPHTIVRMDEITSVRFSQRQVEFSGRGFLHDDPCRVFVTATDNAGTEEADTFAIKCLTEEADHPGEAFAAEGELHSGDIVVGTVD